MKKLGVFWLLSVVTVCASPGLSRAQDGVPQPEELFQRLDKNSDGKVTKDEVPEEQRRFFERSVRVGDKDGDGSLTKDEFIQASKPPEAGSIPLAPGGGPGGDRRGDMRQRLEMMDRNKDGKIALDEIPEPLRERAKAAFDRAGKTELTIEEFGRAMLGPGGGPDGRPDAGALFSRLDKNSDGKITKDEVPDEFKDRMAQAFERLGKDEITREQFMEFSRRLAGQPGSPEGQPRPMSEGARFPLPAFFRQLDANNDGRLSKEELSKAADKFADLDENGDGQLDPRELMGPPPNFAGGPGGNPEMRRPEGAPTPGGGGLGPFFAQLDKNSDGKLSKDEAPERMKEAFGRLDRDSDGFLSAEEMRAGAERFGNRPGSNRPEGEGNRPRRPATEDKKPE